MNWKSLFLPYQVHDTAKNVFFHEKISSRPAYAYHWIAWIIFGSLYTCIPGCLFRKVLPDYLGVCTLSLTDTPLSEWYLTIKELVAIAILLYYLAGMQYTRAPSRLTFGVMFCLGLHMPLSLCFITGGYIIQAMMYVILVWHIIYITAMVQKQYPKQPLKMIEHVGGYIMVIILTSILSNSTLPGTRSELQHHYAFLLLGTFSKLRHPVSVAMCGFSCGICIAGAMSLGVSAFT